MTGYDKQAFQFFWGGGTDHAFKNSLQAKRHTLYGSSDTCAGATVRYLANGIALILNLYIRCAYAYKTIFE